MLAEEKKSTNTLGGIAIILWVIGSVQRGSGRSFAGDTLIAIGLFLWVLACMQYAKGKGHSIYWGFLGLLWLPGFIVLSFMPDRHKVAKL
jgi:hypothetical protein